MSLIGFKKNFFFKQVLSLFYLHEADYAIQMIRGDNMVSQDVSIECLSREDLYQPIGHVRTHFVIILLTQQSSEVVFYRRPADDRPLRDMLESKLHIEDPE